MRETGIVFLPLISSLPSAAPHHTLPTQDDYDHVTLLAEQGVIMSYRPEQVEDVLLGLDSMIATARKEVKKLPIYVPSYVRKSGGLTLKL